MTILDRGIFIVVTAFLFVLLMYVIRLLKKLINKVNNISNRLNSLEMANGKNIPVKGDNKSLTKDEFARLSGMKIIDTVTVISISFISIYCIDAIPNIIEKYAIKYQLGIDFKAFLYVLRDVFSIFIFIFITGHAITIYEKIHFSINDFSRKKLIKIQNVMCRLCIASLISFNAAILALIILPDLKDRLCNFDLFSLTGSVYVFGVVFILLFSMHSIKFSIIK